MTIEIGPNLASCAWPLACVGMVGLVAAGVSIVQVGPHLAANVVDLVRAWRAGR